MMEHLVYYLSSLESKTFENTRECLVVKSMTFSTGKPCVLVKVTPPVLGQSFGLGDRDMDHLILASRHEGQTLVPKPSSFPCFVHIARPVVRIDEIGDLLQEDDVESLAWGEIYRTWDDAENHVFDD